MDQSRPETVGKDIAYSRLGDNPQLLCGAGVLITLSLPLLLLLWYTDLQDSSRPHCPSLEAVPDEAVLLLSTVIVSLQDMAKERMG
jgi:hypothetical protein